MHTVIINGKKRIVDSKELKTIQVVYRGAIEIENFYINNPELLEIKIKNAFIDIVGLLKDLE